MKKNKIASLLLSSLIILQINTVSFSYLNFENFGAKIRNTFCSKTKTSTQSSLFKKIFSPTTFVATAIIAIGLFLIKNGKTISKKAKNIKDKTYYTFKLRSAYKRRDYPEIKKFKKKLDCEGIDEIFRGKNVFSMIFGT